MLTKPLPPDTISVCPYCAYYKRCTYSPNTKSAALTVEERKEEAILCKVAVDADRFYASLGGDI